MCIIPIPVYLFYAFIIRSHFAPTVQTDSENAISLELNYLICEKVWLLLFNHRLVIRSQFALIRIRITDLLYVEGHLLNSYAPTYFVGVYRTFIIKYLGGM